jgi:WD40 repeat protein
VDKTVILWDVSKPDAPRPIGQPLAGHSNFVESVAFSPNGQLLASASVDKTVILWDISKPDAPRPIGQPLAGHSDAVRSVAFSPNGQLLASAGYDKSVILWDVDEVSWVKLACAIANRNLTQAEWRQYLGSRPYGKTCPGFPEGK